jgi:hypothetical protein
MYPAKQVVHEEDPEEQLLQFITEQTVHLFKTAFLM